MKPCFGLAFEKEDPEKSHKYFILYTWHCEIRWKLYHFKPINKR
jgi:hypothetical protein